MVKPKQRIIKRARNYKISVLGLDCSSATIGWGLITDKFRLAAYGHIKPLDNKHPILERLSDTYQRISALCVELKPTYVAIEDIFTYMKGKKSNAKTIITLALFNRVAALAAYHNSQEVFFYSVQEIRKVIKEVVLKSKKTISKEEMPNIIIEKLDGFNLLKNKLNNIAKETYDEADGIAVAWCHMLKGASIERSI